MEIGAQREDRHPGIGAVAPGRTGSAPSGVLVLGMHRSGTSAVAGALHLLGLATCASGDLITGMAWNPEGHWESRSLSRLNDRLLAETGHAWWYPPPPGPAYAGAASRITTTPDVAARTFDATYGAEPWVWKDPRTSVLLPFWRTAFSRPLAAVVVYRDPVDVATSLLARNSLPLAFGVALWARYVRLLLEHCGGLPALVARYDDMVEDPAGWSQSAGSFLTGLGITVPIDAEARLRTFLKPGLRHSPRDGPRDTSHSLGDGGAGLAPGSGAAELLTILDGLVGVHEFMDAPDLGPEEPRVEAELRSRWPGQPPAWNTPPWMSAGQVIGGGRGSPTAD